MQVFDASSMIYAWDNYPIDQFPGLWDWIANEISTSKIVIPTVAFSEVSHKIPECCTWLSEHNIQRIAVSNEIIEIALQAKTLIGVKDDKYHTKGVDENDLIIIATAKSKNADLISEEAKQPTLSSNEPSKRKIPAVCALPDIAVTCLNFVEYLKRSGAIFR